MIRAAVRIVDRILGGALALLLGVMLINVVWQVFGRLVLGTPSSWTEELARFAMIWLALLGASYGVGRRTHLALDLLPMALDDSQQRVLQKIIALVVLLFALVVFVGGGGRLVWVSLQLGQVSAALHWKLGYVYLVLPVTGVLMVFYSIAGMFGIFPEGESAAKIDNPGEDRMVA